jgi:hypothetical protein
MIIVDTIKIYGNWYVYMLYVIYWISCYSNYNYIAYKND